MKTLLRTLTLFTLLIVISSFIDIAQRSFDTFPQYTYFMIIVGFIATSWTCLLRDIFN